MFLVLYFWLGVFYVNVFYYEYVMLEIGSFSVVIVFIMVILILMWMLGYMILWIFYFSGMLFFQIRIIFCGQILYERKKKKKEYDFGWK